MQTQPIIHIVDDDKMFQVGVSRLLAAAGYEVRNYPNAAEFLVANFDEDRPGCILMDFRMPGLNGLELQKVLSKQAVALPIVFLTGYGDIPTTVTAIKAGAIDFLTKPVKREILLQTIRKALSLGMEKNFCSEQLKSWRASYETLTARELEVFQRVVIGKMNKEIASELGAAERTVKAHRAQMMEKMRATSIAELVHIADQLQAIQSRAAAPEMRL